ncbi:MAG: pyruvate ferredoxin oxidoreductase, partial [Lachnospiraceae bacterium]|nr:pyruvate ferredoxin oxidoreductase [Lachnospiraceae bacterium]
MAYNLKEWSDRPERFVSGHRMCAVLRAVHPEDHAVVTCATSCLEVASVTYPYSSWTDSYIHTAFENSAATCSGVEAAYRALKKKGKIEGEYKFITFGGDG